MGKKTIEIRTTALSASDQDDWGVLPLHPYMAKRNSPNRNLEYPLIDFLLSLLYFSLEPLQRGFPLEGAYLRNPGQARPSFHAGIPKIAVPMQMLHFESQMLVAVCILSEKAGSSGEPRQQILNRLLPAAMPLT